MILHFNYNVGKIFYGIDVVGENETGQIPNSTHTIRGLFYHLPIIWILITIYIANKFVKIGLCILSFVYTIAHAMHLFGEYMKPERDISQLSLLFLVLIVSFLLNYEYYKSINEK